MSTKDQNRARVEQLKKDAEQRGFERGRAIGLQEGKLQPPTVVEMSPHVEVDMKNVV